MNELVRALYCSAEGDETTVELDCGDVHPVVLFYPDKIQIQHCGCFLLRQDLKRNKELVERLINYLNGCNETSKGEWRLAAEEEGVYLEYYAEMDRQCSQEVLCGIVQMLVDTAGIVKEAAWYITQNQETA